MTEPDPATLAQADQNGKLIGDIVDELLAQVALLGMAGQLVQVEKLDKDELRGRVTEFLGELAQIPPQLKDAVIFELCDRHIRAHDVMRIEVLHPAMQDPDEL